jgi:hypothetical protein
MVNILSYLFIFQCHLRHLSPINNYLLQKQVWCFFSFAFSFSFSFLFSFSFHFQLIIFIVFADILTGQVTTIAGYDKRSQGGIGSNAKMNGPVGMCFNPHDNCLYISDMSNNKIRKVSMNGIFYLHLSSQNIHTQTQEK